MKVMGGFLLVVFILFVHVWIPIQSERNLAAMRRLEGQVSLKKAELNELNDQYAKMTSLTMGKTVTAQVPTLNLSGTGPCPRRALQSLAGAVRAFKAQPLLDHSTSHAHGG
jgi:hypothetical protein